MRRGGEIPPFTDKIVNVKYEVPDHKHKLSLISSSSSHDDQNEEDKNSDDDEYGLGKSELICDWCITPIFQKKQIRSSSRSFADKEHYYMSCSECKYYLHWECFHMPPQLPSLPLHDDPHHELVLQSCAKLEFGAKCHVCGLYTNGLTYACTRCSFKPDSIYHENHPQHLLSHLSKVEMFGDSCSGWCDAGCGYTASTFDCYVCGSCDFVVHVRCAVLPASTANRRWEVEHPLPLTFDANLNHPGEFYCDHCEEQMYPKMWMYHCRRCDLSFHPHCFPAISGRYRNIKFGQQYAIATAHPHALTYEFLTIKRRCDACRRDAYGERGFQYASCNFFICLDRCGQQMLENAHIQTVD